MFKKFMRISFPFVVALLAVLSLLSFLQSKLVLASTSAGPILVQGPYDGPDANIFQAVLNEFYSQTQISVTYEYVPDVYSVLIDCSQNGNCPDLGVLYNPGGIRQLARQGNLLALDDVVVDFDLYYSSHWRDLSSNGSTLYAIPLRAVDKSLVWFRSQTFIDTGVSVPLNWTAWISTSQELLDNGVTPFSIGLESGSASGWPMTDWFESVLVSSQGEDKHQRLVEHTLSWTDDSVVETFDYLSQIFGNPSYQAGGISGTVDTFFGDAITSVFTSPYKAGMFMGGTFMEDFLPGGLTQITDYNTFDFPQIDPQHGQPVILGADWAVVITDTIETRQLIQYLASPEANEMLVSLGFGLSPNQGVDPQSYPDELTRKWAETTATGTVVFDLDDQLPPDLQQLIWAKFLEYVAHPERLDIILAEIEAKATSMQGSPYRIFLPVTLRNQQ